MSESDNSFDAGELLEIGTRFREVIAIPLDFQILYFSLYENMLLFQKIISQD